jgi:hypothetical protein
VVTVFSTWSRSRSGACTNGEPFLTAQDFMQFWRVLTHTIYIKKQILLYIRVRGHDSISNKYDHIFNVYLRNTTSVI